MSNAGKTTEALRFRIAAVVRTLAGKVSCWLGDHAWRLSGTLTWAVYCHQCKKPGA